MTTLKEEEFDTFVKRRLSNFSSLLIHGDDEAVVSSMASQAIAQFSEESAATFIVDEVDILACKRAPGIFSDALNAMSLLGDKRLLVLGPVDDSTLGFLGPVIEHVPGGNFVLLRAEALRRDSRLRLAFESGVYSASVAVFPDDEQTASSRARALLNASGLSWSDGAEGSFFELVGFDRSIVNQELTKLILYCHGAKVVKREDVTDVCGDLAEDSLDDVIDAILSGDLSSLDRNLADATGRDAKSILPMLSFHLARLVNLNTTMNEGQSAEGAVRSARPPIFFKRRSAVIGQLSHLSLNDLLRLQASVQSFILRSRQLGQIADASTTRSLLSLARNLKRGVI